VFRADLAGQRRPISGCQSWGELPSQRLELLLDLQALEVEDVAGPFASLVSVKIRVRKAVELHGRIIVPAI
jgi:hypothetical protein